MEQINLYPWVISVDKEKSIEFYSNNDLSIDKSLNDALVEILDTQTLEFLGNFGIDMSKIYVEFMSFPEIEEEEISSRDLYKIEFVLGGYFEAIPRSQWEFYFEYIDDEPPIFEVGENAPEIIDVDDCIYAHESEDKMGMYRFGAASTVYENFEGWNSGYILCRGFFLV